MKQFTDIKSLAKDFTQNAMQSPRCPDGNIIYIVKLVNATLTIRCYPTQPDVVARAKKLTKAYANTNGGTDGFKDWKKSVAMRTKMSSDKTTNKRPPFSWSMARELSNDRNHSDDVNEANALNYFKLYNKTPYYCVGNPSPENDTLILDAQVVEDFPEIIIGRIRDVTTYCAFHIASGMTLNTITESTTRAGAIKLLKEYDQPKLKNGLEAQKNNTFQREKLAAMGIIL